MVSVVFVSMFHTWGLEFSEVQLWEFFGRVSCDWWLLVIGFTGNFKQNRMHHTLCATT